MPKVRYNKAKRKYCIDYKDIDGSRRIITKFKTKKEANEALRLALEEIDEILNPSSVTVSRRLFKYVAEEFIDTYASLYCKESTVKSYKGYLKNHILPVIGDMRVGDIKASNIRLLLKNLQSKTINNRKNPDMLLKNATINKIKKLIGTIYQSLINDDLFNYNPASRVKSLREDSEEIIPLTKQECQKLLATAKKHYPTFYPLLAVAIFTGMRKGEILALRWEDINWESSIIVVRRNYTHGKLSRPKTNQIRRIKIPRKLKLILREWQLKAKPNENDLIFCNEAGNYLDQNNIAKRLFKPCLRRSGLNSIRFHDLRHTYASLMLSEGATINYVQKQLGHSTPVVTLNTYSHLMPEALKDCTDLWDKIMAEDNAEVKNDTLVEQSYLMRNEVEH